MVEGTRRRYSVASTEVLDDGIARFAPSKTARALAALFFGSLQIKWPIYEAILYGQ